MRLAPFLLVGLLAAPAAAQNGAVPAYTLTLIDPAPALTQIESTARVARPSTIFLRIGSPPDDCRGQCSRAAPGT